MSIRLSTKARLCVRVGAWVILVSLAGGVRAAPAAEWAQWRGPSRDGLSSEAGWQATWGADGPKVLWRANVGIGFSSCSIAGGRVYTIGNIDKKDIVWCLNADTGKPVWQHTYPCRLGTHKGSRMTPTVDGDAVYTMSREGDLYCLSAADGTVRWSAQIKDDFGAKQTRYNWGFSCSPMVRGDLLIFDVGTVIALNKKTGKLAWSSGSDLAGFSSPTTTTLGGETYINAFTASGLVLVNAASGKEFARFPWETKYLINSASPISVGAKIFFSSGYGKGCGLVEVRGNRIELVYANEDMRNHVNSCVLYKEHLYGFDGQQGSTGRLTCMELATGAVKWAEGDMKVGSLMIADGKIVAMLDGGELLIAEATPEAYRPLARAKVLNGQCWTYPVLCGGRIYCRSNKEGELVCLDVSGK